MLCKALYYFKSDPKGAVLLSYNNLRRMAIRAVCGIVMKLKCKLIGIQYLTGVKWGGVMQIERFPNSCISIGKGCTFNSKSIYNQRGVSRCIIQTGAEEARIVIGDNCGFSGVSIVADKEVIIGNRVMVGANTRIGDRDDHPRRLGTIPASVVIEDDVFIGMSCLIMKGVRIGEKSVVAAGSIVTHDVPPYCVVAGIPAKIIKNLI